MTESGRPERRTLTVNGITLAVTVQGTGPPVVLCHGFPQLGYSWRHQLAALAAAGYLAIAPDQRGYGRSSVPAEVAAYTQERLCGDLVALLDAFGLERAVFVGHDMGGSVVWNLAACHPERVAAVGAIGTPYTPPGRAPLPEIWRRADGGGGYRMFDYQLYFQDQGPAEAELERDVARSLRLLLRTPADGDEALAGFGDVRARGGLLAGLPDPPASRMLTGADLSYYVRAFQLTGFGGALNWYRNYRAWWEWLLDKASHPIRGPALLISPGLDPVLTENLSTGMERLVPGLRRVRLPDCGHYAPEEQPGRVSEILVDWLDSTRGRWCGR